MALASIPFVIHQICRMVEENLYPPLSLSTMTVLSFLSLISEFASQILGGPGPGAATTHPVLLFTHIADPSYLDVPVLRRRQGVPNYTIPWTLPFASSEPSPLPLFLPLIPNGRKEKTVLRIQWTRYQIPHCRPSNGHTSASASPLLRSARWSRRRFTSVSVLRS